MAGLARSRSTTSEGMGAADRWATEEGGIPSLDLMETAGRAAGRSRRAEVAGSGPIRIVCGKGNNGGDGLVAARHLVETGYSAEVLLLYPVDDLSPDAFANYRRLIGVEIFEGAGGPLPPRRIRARSSTRCSGPASKASRGIRRARRSSAINASGATVVSCDIPSGVNASTGEAGTRRRRRITP